MVSEEIFKSDEAFWFSPDSNYILYATFNDTDVGKISLTKFSSKENYPKMQTVSYPKVSENKRFIVLLFLIMFNLVERGYYI